ncbi:hypothetical protein G6F56_000184 [Rhizopus delemar]|uniref:Uncharacterized protein n=1 Tax=Rhizopus stolonifer TaxID=4846 RepID=A0A367KVK7_RHIST|nr:hypothetical protein G6F56_000184 [Rhizopus delemar]RCI06231.1 hypothetical protein CU098_013680 [Rhizopus stolonifer]
MGLVEKFKDNIGYYKLEKYTKRRVSKSQFESHDRRYYENAYRDGVYVDPDQAQCDNSTRTYLSYKQQPRWSFTDLLKKPNNSKSAATTHLKNSENYNSGRA